MFEFMVLSTRFSSTKLSAFVHNVWNSVYSLYCHLLHKVVKFLCEIECTTAAVLCFVHFSFSRWIVVSPLCRLIFVDDSFLNEFKQCYGVKNEEQDESTKFLCNSMFSILQYMISDIMQSYRDQIKKERTCWTCGTGRAEELFVRTSRTFYLRISCDNLNSNVKLSELQLFFSQNKFSPLIDLPDRQITIRLL